MSHDLLKLARQEILAMQAYRSARSEQKTGKIWLDANENPWQTQNNRYPEPQPEAIIEKFSSIFGARPNNILVTRGSDEGIDLLLRAFCQAGKDKILICPPTYGMYQIAAQIQGAEIMRVPLLKEEGFALDIKEIMRIWQPTTKLIFLCSPNNPTGNLLNIESILSICQQLKNKSLVIVDQAYIDFTTKQSLVDYMSDYPNLVFLRTLSKAYGLAGIRCGALLAQESIIALLKKVMTPYPIPQPVIDLVLKKLSALEYAQVQEQCSVINSEREMMISFLEKLPFVKKVWPSVANFILFQVTDITYIMTQCQKNGIILRDRSGELDLENCIRVSIGTPEENALLKEVLANA